MPALSLDVEAVTRSYGGLQVLQDVSFSVRAGELVSLIGPSGAGKSTLLRLLAGMEQPDSGTIRFSRPPDLASPVILVFQDYLLFPHMSVFENVAFGLRSRRLPRQEVADRVHAVLAEFGLRDKVSSWPAALSAGQKQRVAIARALVVRPGVLLLDEPFANLDRNLKIETAEFIRSTQRHFGVTTVSVTHDLQEAFAMSDRIGILLGGRLVQYDEVRTLYFNPASWETARFLGPVNVIPRALWPELGVRCEGGDSVCARAEAILITPDPSGSGLVTAVRFNGMLIQYTVRVRDTDITVFALGDGIAPNDRVRLCVTSCFTPGGGTT